MSSRHDLYCCSGAVLSCLRGFLPCFAMTTTVGLTIRLASKWAANLLFSINAPVKEFLKGPRSHSRAKPPRLGSNLPLDFGSPEAPLDPQHPIREDEPRKVTWSI
jgi:hypothetical protein